MSNSDQKTSPVESRIAVGFARINTALRSKAWARAGASGLTPTQADILGMLAARKTALRLSAVAEQSAISAATASDAVAALVNKGLVEKGRASDDGRAVALSLTRSGARMAASVADWSAFLGSAAATLSEQEQAVLLKLLVKMIRELQEQGDIPVGRMCVNCKYFEPNRHRDPHAPHHCRLVDAAFGDGQLRLDCADHEAAEQAVQFRNWATFAGR